MKTEKEWDQDILKITMKMHQVFPELAQYLKEMPLKDSGNGNKGNSIKDLEEYHNSLAELIRGYSKTHPGPKVKNDIEKAKFPNFGDDSHNDLEEKKD